MGIKGIYNELGPGRRISLAKLATEHLENSGRPLRLAIDIAIWQFQTQAARGGTNPAIRTLFYRLVRLLALGIHPIFVFDGPHKPAFKRNKRSGRGDGVATAMAKRLIRLFGFPTHDAPGEAEAECALLQQQGIADAVLSEDVDTIMFGCTRTLRSWTVEGVRGSKTLTHVSMYDVHDLLSAGLDREGMVLVALMSGGDYIPEGVPGCGVKLACEAAKAGFGKTLCRLKSCDSASFEKWKTSLKHELCTNESGFFRVRHKALSIPDEFPNRQVLRHYTHPVVSDAATIDKLKTSIGWSRPIDVQGIRYFVDETFDWVNKVGAVKLTRVLSPGLLVRKLLERSFSSSSSKVTPEQMEREEAALIKRISGRRSHHSTDGITELRVAHIPADIVGLDLSQEIDEVVAFDRQGLALNSDDDFDAVVDGDTEATHSKAKAKRAYDPMDSDLIWLPESLLKVSVPLTVEDWEEKQLSRLSGKSSKKQSSKTMTREVGALDKWVQITKITTTTGASSMQDTRVKNSSKAPPATKPQGSSMLKFAPAASQRPSLARCSVNRSKQSRPCGKATAAEPTRHKNPWAYAGSQHMPRITKSHVAPEPIVLSSGPLRASSTPPPACPSLTSASARHIIDLSVSDEAYPSKPIQTPAQSSTSKFQQNGHQGSTTSSREPPRTPSRTMRQTRIYSLITISPKRHVRCEYGETAPRSELVVESSSKSCANAGLKQDRSKPSRPGETLAGQCSAMWTDDDTSGGHQVVAARRPRKMTVPRTSACGFFKIVEMGDKKTGGGCAIWQQSAPFVIDLTGDENP